MTTPSLAVLTVLLLLVQTAPVTSGRGPTPSASPAADDDPYASGWAVVVLDEPISTVVAGEETVVSFRVLRLGRVDGEVADAIVVFTIRHVETDASVTEIAQLRDNRADYEATFTLQREGAWEWIGFVYNTGSMN